MLPIATARVRALLSAFGRGQGEAGPARARTPTRIPAETVTAARPPGRAFPFGPVPRTPSLPVAARVWRAQIVTDSRPKARHGTTEIAGPAGQSSRSKSQKSR